MTQMKKLLFLLSIAMITTSGFAQNRILPLWENDPPNYRETGEVTIWDTSDIVRVRLVQKPDIAVREGDIISLPMIGKAVILPIGLIRKALLPLCLSTGSRFQKAILCRINPHY